MGRSPYFIPFTVVSYGLAAATASLRVLSGMHFTTDVLAGAALGSAFGFLVPFLHQRTASMQEKTGFRIDVGADGVMLSYAF